MQINEHLHALRIPFTIPVAPDKTLPRFVYVYVVLGDREVWLVDTGVAGTEERIAEYLRKIGRGPDEVSTVVLTHSHPDHIGAVAAIQQETNCSVLIHEAERPWLEDVNRQFQERPVPGFDALVDGPAHVTGTFGNGDRLLIDEAIALKVLHTPGHSAGSVSFWIESEGTLITGDAVISAGDLPIYDDYRQCVWSIERLAAMQGVKTLLSSWDEPKQDEAIGRCFQEGLEYLARIDEAIRQVADGPPEDTMELCREVVEKLGLPPAAVNPLVARALMSHLEAPQISRTNQAIPAGLTPLAAGQEMEMICGAGVPPTDSLPARHPSPLNDRSCPNILRHPLGRLILTAWFFTAVFGALWWQFGVVALLIGLAWIVLGFALSLVRRLLPSWQGDEEGTERNEQVLSSNPTEAKTAKRRITSNLALAFGGYPILVSSILAGFIGAPFWIVLGAVASGMAFTAALFLIWATSWSLSSGARWNQFSISTLLLLTTISAMYLGVIRLLADLSGKQLGTEEQPFVAVAVACFVLTGFSLPFLLIYAEHLIWLAAWFVRGPWVQDRLKPLRSSETSPLRVEEDKESRL